MPNHTKKHREAGNAENTHHADTNIPRENAEKGMSGFFKKFRRPNKSTLVANSKEKETPNYFQTAQSWSDDYYAVAVSSANRWRAMSVFALMPLLGLSLVCMAFLIPMQHLEPLLINHYPDGVVTVLPASQLAPPQNTAEVQSDIVRYVETRESYSAFSYQLQYQLVLLLSSNSVAESYANGQAGTDKTAPVNVLGNTGVKRVHVSDVLFLDNQSNNNPAQHIDSHQNLAQVNFTVTTTQNSLTHTIAYTALISWNYQGTPDNPSDAWRNWDGFTVTQYQVQAENT